MGVLAAWWLGSSPRMRGTRIPIASATSRWGSSPRMRGTPPCANAYENLCGIIPAYAGNTSYRTCRCKSRMDHPRVCGEHLPFYSGFHPPLRIIPAYAGNTFGHSVGFIGNWDHPRVCGEHLLDGQPKKTELGSSPRMRGTHFARTL